MLGFRTLKRVKTFDKAAVPKIAVRLCTVPFVQARREAILENC
jgi:hypothetical protein